jgi:hypothetical protein
MLRCYRAGGGRRTLSNTKPADHNARDVRVAGHRGRQDATPHAGDAGAHAVIAVLSVLPQPRTRWLADGSLPLARVGGSIVRPVRGRHRAAQIQPPMSWQTARRGQRRASQPDSRPAGGNVPLAGTT